MKSKINLFTLTTKNTKKTKKKYKNTKKKYKKKYKKKMNKIIQYVLSVPVSIVLFLVFTTVYILCHAGIVKVNCAHTLVAELQSFFVHTHLLHYLGTIISLALISRFEYDIGSISFLLICLSILACCTLTEYAIRFSPKSSCTIGASGIILGIAIAEIINDKKKVDWNALLAILILILYPNLTNPCSSLTGYVIGCVSGVIIGFLFNNHMIETLQVFRRKSGTYAPLIEKKRFQIVNPLDVKLKNAYRFK
jgi:hypothetical protein